MTGTNPSHTLPGAALRAGSVPLARVVIMAAIVPEIDGLGTLFRKAASFVRATL